MEITANMFKAKRVLNEAWAELSPAHRNER